MTPTKIRSVLRAKDTEALAAEFVMMTTGTKRHGKLYTAQNVLDELASRVGPVQLQIEIQHARDTLKLFGLTDVDIVRR